MSVASVPRLGRLGFRSALSAKTLPPARLPDFLLPYHPLHGVARSAVCHHCHSLDRTHNQTEAFRNQPDKCPLGLERVEDAPSGVA